MAPPGKRTATTTGGPPARKMLVFFHGLYKKQNFFSKRDETDKSGFESKLQELQGEFLFNLLIIKILFRC